MRRARPVVPVVRQILYGLPVLLAVGLFVGLMALIPEVIIGLCVMGLLLLVAWLMGDIVQDVLRDRQRTRTVRAERRPRGKRPEQD